MRAIIMPNRSYSFARAHRRRWGLTQAELAALLGVGSSTTVSRIERSARRPTANNVIAYCILFGLPPSELFLSMHGEIEEIVVAAAKHLYDELDTKSDKLSLRKREFLEQALRRITSPNPPNNV